MTTTAASEAGFLPGVISAWSVDLDRGSIRLATGESVLVLGALSDWQVSCSPFVGQPVAVKVDVLADGQRIVRVRSAA